MDLDEEASANVTALQGFITVSEKPGIGVDINEEAMRRYATLVIPFFA